MMSQDVDRSEVKGFLCSEDSDPGSRRGLGLSGCDGMHMELFCCRKKLGHIVELGQRWGGGTTR